MGKRVVMGIVISIFLLVNTGCNEIVKRKFVRKKKKVNGVEAIYNLKPFTAPANAEVYGNAFIFWKTWESELLQNLQQKGYASLRNDLKIKECSEQSLINLGQMRKLLKEKKAQELDKYIEELKEIGDTIKGLNFSDAQAGRIRNDIERHKRIIERNFCLTSVKEDILPDPPRVEKMDTAEESPVFLEKKPGGKKKRRARPTEGYYPKPF